MTGFNGAQTAPQEEQGLDLEGHIRAGIEAFMQSQDPAIAVEVCNLLASEMGISPEVDPYAEQQSAVQAPTQSQGGVPMARNGMRMYKKGGKLGGGGKTPEKKAMSKGATTQLSPERKVNSEFFAPQDMNSGAVQSRHTTPELGIFLNENPAKTGKRSRIQSAAHVGKYEDHGGYRVGNQLAYDHGAAEGELAGEFKQIEFKVPAMNHTLPALDIPEIDLNPVPNPPSVDAAQIRQKNGPVGKRRLPRVDYLQGKGNGRNKRTESGY